MKIVHFIAMGMLVLGIHTAQSQVSVSVNIGSPPSWGPVGYAEEVEYYYLPDVESYYDIRAHQFIYFNRGGWIRSRHLPYQYRNYDLYSGYKVVMSDYHGSRPYANFDNYKVKYHKGYREGPQKSYGVRQERREVRREPQRRVESKQRGGNDRQGGGNKQEGRGDKGRGGDKGHGGEKGRG